MPPFQIDDELLYDWAPHHLHVFVRGVIVDILVRFMKVAMESPSLFTNRNGIGMYSVINQSILEQVSVLEIEIDTMDQHSYNQEIIEIYYNYEDELKYNSDEMSRLITIIGDYISNFFYNPSELKDKIWARISDYKNVLVFRNRHGVTFRLLARDSIGTSNVKYG